MLKKILERRIKILESFFREKPDSALQLAAVYFDEMTAYKKIAGKKSREAKLIDECNAKIIELISHNIERLSPFARQTLLSCTLQSGLSKHDGIEGASLKGKFYNPRLVSADTKLADPSHIR